MLTEKAFALGVRSRILFVEPIAHPVTFGALIEKKPPVGFVADEALRINVDPVPSNDVHPFEASGAKVSVAASVWL
jgi:hypothetical protein